MTLSDALLYQGLVLLLLSILALAVWEISEGTRGWKRVSGVLVFASMGSFLAAIWTGVIW